MSLFGPPNVEKMKVKRNIQGLVKALNYNRKSSKGSDVRKAAARALCELKDISAVEPLITMVEDEDSDVRETTARALGELKDTRAVEPLITMLNDKDSSVRQAAAGALGELKDTRAVEPLNKMMLKDKDPYVRLGVFWALVELKDTPRVETLITMLKDENSFVRKAVIYALGRFKDTRAVEPLITMLKDEDSDVRLAAVLTLGELEDTRAVKSLVNTMQNDRKPSVRNAATKALNQMSWRPEDIEKIQVPSLLDELANSEVNLRTAKRLFAIIRLLRLSGDKRAVPALTKLEKDIDELIVEVNEEISQGQTGGEFFSATLPSVLSEMENLHAAAKDARVAIEHKV